MRYRLEMQIDRSRDEVVALFLDPDHLRAWQPDLVSFMQIEGVAREQGAVSRQVHRMGRREITMTETITEQAPPERFAAVYEAEGVWNLVENRFIDLGDGRTDWKLATEFRCRGLLKLMTWLAPGMFRKQTRLFMERFRDFAEAHPG